MISKKSNAYKMHYKMNSGPDSEYFSFINYLKKLIRAEHFGIGGDYDGGDLIVSSSRRTRRHE